MSRLKWFVILLVPVGLLTPAPPFTAEEGGGLGNG